jgi:hypothetical protein
MMSDSIPSVTQRAQGPVTASAATATSALVGTGPLPATHGSGRRERFALFMSLVCLVHCVGLAVLAPLLPGIFALVAHQPILEAILWGSSVTLGAFPAFGRSALGRRAWTLPTWVIAVAIGGVGLALARDALVIASLIVLSAVQVSALVARARAHRLACNPSAGPVDCCDHQH